MKQSKPQPDRWALVFQAEGPGQPLPMRVKLLLKAALRRYGLRCADYWRIDPDQDGGRGKAPPYVRSGVRSDPGPTYNPSGNSTRQNQSVEPSGKGATP